MLTYSFIGYAICEQLFLYSLHTVNNFKKEEKKKLKYAIRYIRRLICDTKRDSSTLHPLIIEVNKCSFPKHTLKNK